VYKSEAVIGVGILILIATLSFVSGPITPIYLLLGILVVVAGFLMALLR